MNDRPVNDRRANDRPACDGPGAHLPVPSSGGLRISAGVVIPAAELSWRFTTAGGPGGQHVNTSHTRAEVTLDLERSPSLPAALRERLVARFGPTITVGAGERRSQAQNRDLALRRLAERLRDAAVERRPRRPTGPSAASRRRRLDAKRRQAQRKRDRRASPDEE